MKLTGILLASMLLVGFCHAQDRTAAHPPPIAAESTRYGWADVLRVDPVYEPVSDAAPPALSDDGRPAARPDCNEEPPPPPPQHDGEQANNRATGTMIGALIGVVVGHAFGRGDGNKAATVAGGVAGGIAGNRIAAAQDQAANNQMQQQADAERDAVTASLRDCHEARPIRGTTQPERRIIGYDVEYRYKGEIYMARLPFDPGDRMRVKITVVPVE